MSFLIKKFLFVRYHLAWVTAAFLTIVLTCLAVTSGRTHDENQEAARTAIQAAELRSTIRYLNYYASSIAFLGAATAEKRCTERYEEAVSQLDAAISSAIELASPLSKVALTSTLTEARHDLVIMARRALNLAQAGRPSLAQALLNGPEYTYLQNVYENGTAVFSNELTDISNRQSSNLLAQARFETISLALCAIFFGATTISLKGRRNLQTALEQTSIVARTDMLTGLANRRQFDEVLRNAIELGRRRGVDHALMLIDLDRFKPVNDAHGHPAGDELLRMVAARLRSVLRNNEHIGRLGGDEFAFILRCDPAAADQPRADPRLVAERVIQALDQPFVLAEGLTVQIGASIGISIAHAGHTNIDELVRDADVALYRAKVAGRGCARQTEPNQQVGPRLRTAEKQEAEVVPQVQSDSVSSWCAPIR